MLTLYSKPNCFYCSSTKAWLAEHDLAFVEIDVMQDEEALTFLREQGHKSVPQLYHKGTLLAGGFEGLRTLGYAKIKALLDG